MNWRQVRRATAVASAAMFAVAATAAPQAANESTTSTFARAAANGHLANEAFVRSDYLMMVRGVRRE